MKNRFWKYLAYKKYKSDHQHKLNSTAYTRSSLKMYLLHKNLLNMCNREDNFCLNFKSSWHKLGCLRTLDTWNDIFYRKGLHRFEKKLFYKDKRVSQLYLIYLYKTNNLRLNWYKIRTWSCSTYIQVNSQLFQTNHFNKGIWWERKKCF